MHSQNKDGYFYNVHSFARLIAISLRIIYHASNQSKYKLAQIGKKENMTYLKKTKLDDYLDIETFVKRYPQIKVNQLRWLVVKKKKYGLEDSIKRLGRRLYFHVPSIIKFLENTPGDPINRPKKGKRIKKEV